MWRKLALALSSLLRRRTPGRGAAAPRFTVGLNARLLLTVTAGAAQPRPTAGGARLVGATLNVSETGVAVVLPGPGAGEHPLGDGSPVHITLELFPDGVVEMEGVVVRREECAGGDPSRGYVVGVRITGMSHGDRARYVEYLGTRGWERAALEDGE